MNRNRKGKLHIVYRTTALTLAAAVAIPSVLTPAIANRPYGALSAIAAMSTVRAANDPITYEYYTTVLKNKVPSSWIFVGTYLIDTAIQQRGIL